MLAIDCIQTAPAGANAYLVSRNGTGVIIDAGEGVERLAEQARAQGIALSAVLLTHGHYDHICGLPALLAQQTLPVYLHHAEIAHARDPVLNLSTLFARRFSLQVPLLPIAQGDTVAVGPLAFSVLHMPGHTLGSCCYRVEDALFTGDTLFCNTVGRTDFLFGDHAQLLRSLQRLLPLPDDVAVYPGHMQATTMGAERAHNPFLREAMA